MCATIAAFVAVASGYGAKPSRVHRAELALAKSEVGSSEAEHAYRELKMALRKQQEQMKRMNMQQGAAKLAAKSKKITSLDEEEAAADKAPAEDAAAAQEAPAEDAAPEEASDEAPVEDDEAATDTSGYSSPPCPCPWRLRPPLQAVSLSRVAYQHRVSPRDSTDNASG